MTPVLEELARDPGNLFARYGNIVIQVRSGDMTRDMLHRIERSALLARASLGGSIGAITVIEEGATLASADIRAEQAVVVKRLLRDPRTHFVSVVVGQSVATRAINTVMRMLLIGVPRMRTAGTVDEAIAWLVPKMGTVTESELRAAVEDARARLRAG